MDILACPIDKHHPLELLIFKQSDEIAEGIIICPKCHRWYPIRDEIPEMLPDELRDKKDELPFMKKWQNQIPEKILHKGKPFNIAQLSSNRIKWYNQGFFINLFGNYFESGSLE